MADPAPPLDLAELDAEIAYGREYAPVWERDQWYVAYMHDVPALVARVRALEAFIAAVRDHGYDAAVEVLGEPH